MRTNYILAVLAMIAGISAAFTNHSKKNKLYPDWKFQKEQVQGESARFISASHLADLIYNKEENILIYDTRDWDAFKEYHIPTALLYDPGMGSKAAIKSATLVLYGEEAHADLHKLAKELPGRVYLLKGGIEAWYSLVLFPDFSTLHVRNRDQLDHVLQRSVFFGGKPQNTQILNLDVRETRYREGC